MAADKLADSGGLRVSVTKIYRINGHLVGSAGCSPAANEIMAWFARGADPSDFPEHQRSNENWAGLLVVKPDGGILKFEATPYPVILDPGQQMAIGSGRDFAMAAMLLGKDAMGAVEVACRLDCGCGGGVDFLTL